MRYTEFMWEAHEYINSLEEPVQRGEAEPITAEEWADWIRYETAGQFTEEQIGWIVERLEDDRFVRDV